MTKNQIRYLKCLGYTDTEEDGAIMQFKRIGNDGFIWKGQSFEYVLNNFTANYKRGYLRRAAKRIIDEI